MLPHQYHSHPLDVKRDTARYSAYGCNLYSAFPVSGQNGILPWIDNPAAPMDPAGLPKIAHCKNSDDPHI